VPGTPAMRFVHAKQLHVERSATHVRERGVWFDDLNVT